jgi:molecular chaperone GrpE (heat shock protein)
MAKDDRIQDSEFEAQLKGLFQEAEERIEERNAVAERRQTVVEEGIEEKIREEAGLVVAGRSYVSLPQMLRPLIIGIQAGVRATSEQSLALQRMEEKMDLSADKGMKRELAGGEEGGTGAFLDELRAVLDQKNAVSQKMFDALHEELKGYKDGFLLESVQKPIIRDLVTLFDDLGAIRGQISEGLAKANGGDYGEFLENLLRRIEINLKNHGLALLEILARLDVTEEDPGAGKLDKIRQRAVAVEMAEFPEEDGLIVRSLKVGFQWKGKVFRPEEVVMKKWKEGFLEVMGSSTDQK